MKLILNVKGAERKSLAGALSQELNAPTKYLGMPTAAYEIGGYHIDKNGTVTGADNSELVSRLEAQGFNGEVEYDNLPCAEEAGENAPDDNSEEKNADGLVVEVPITGFTPEKLDNLTNMVNAKTALLKAALDTDELPIEQTGDTLKFPWFKGEIDAEHAEAYTTLISLLCKTAIKKTRVTAKEKEIDGNPKYAFRCFLLALGFIGKEYQQSRKILLSRLSGDSSWKFGKKEDMLAVENEIHSLPLAILADTQEIPSLPTELAAN